MLARGVRAWVDHTGHTPRWVEKWSTRRAPLPGFEADDLYLLGVAFAVAAALFGFAVLQDDAGSALYRHVHRSLWVGAYWAGAVLVLVGLGARWHRAVWLGHGLLGSAYASMLVGLLFATEGRVAVYLSIFGPFAALHWWTWARVGFRVPAQNVVSEPVDG